MWCFCGNFVWQLWPVLLVMQCTYYTLKTQISVVKSLLLECVELGWIFSFSKFIIHSCKYRLSFLWTTRERKVKLAVKKNQLTEEKSSANKIGIWKKDSRCKNIKLGEKLALSKLLLNVTYVNFPSSPLHKKLWHNRGPKLNGCGFTPGMTIFPTVVKIKWNLMSNMDRALNGTLLVLL